MRQSKELEIKSYIRLCVKNFMRLQFKFELTKLELKQISCAFRCISKQTSRASMDSAFDRCQAQDDGQEIEGCAEKVFQGTGNRRHARHASTMATLHYIATQICYIHRPIRDTRGPTYRQKA